MFLKDKSVLAIDDATAIRTFLRISIETKGAVFHEATTATQGLEMARRLQPDLIVLDLGLPDMDGLEILPALKHNEEKPIVIVLTVRKEQHLQEEAMARGANAIIIKPFLMEDLLDVISQQIHNG